MPEREVLARYFQKSEPPDDSDGGGGARDDVVEALLSAMPGAALADLFSDVLQGCHPRYRSLALGCATELLGCQNSVAFPSLEVKSTQIHDGHVSVKGTVKNAGCLVVLGDLTIEGNYVAAGAGYATLYVGGVLRAHNLYAHETEIICGSAIAVKNLLVLVQNHTVTVSPRVECRVAITDDARINGVLSAQVHEEDVLFADYARYFGIEGIDGEEDEEEARDRVLSDLLRGTREWDSANQSGSSFAVSSRDARRAFLLTCWTGDSAGVRGHLAAGIDPNVCDRSGNGLMRAATRGHLEVVNELLAAGADPNLKATHALVAAASEGNESIVRRLLAAGADPSTKGGALQLNARDYAASEKIARIVDEAMKQTSPPRG